MFFLAIAVFIKIVEKTQRSKIDIECKEVASKEKTIKT